MHLFEKSDELTPFKPLLPPSAQIALEMVSEID
jgi:hypothetical protein